MTAETIAQVGKNCWKTAQAERVAVLIDGENYFRALYAAIQQARHSVYILSWDIDSRIKLIRSDADLANANLPTDLGTFISRVLQHNSELNVYILNWDWAMVYTLEREWLPMYKPEWHAQPRLHFKFDGSCPVGSSQHQKVVVIDDQIAFSGGIDPGRHRWDSSDHAANDPRRRDPDNQPYPPFHDAMMMVDGEAAKALGTLARQRWLVATGEQLTPPPTVATSAWPDSVEPWFTETQVAIARTLPDYAGRPEVREVEAMYLDSIAAAEHSIYIENQYFTSWKFADVLAKRLQEENGPEVVLVLPLKTGGWLEQMTMDVLRHRVVCQLQAADTHQRLRICYPHHEDYGDTYISVHAKIMVVDDKLMRIGSANLSNRSMGFDSECDLIIEARNDVEAAGIRRFRERLLGEHLDMTQAELKQALSADPSLLALIDSRQDFPRTLKPLDCVVPGYVDEMLPSSAIVDPEKPMSADAMTQLFIPDEQRHTADRQWWKIVLALLLVLLLTALWRWTPLSDWLNPELLKNAAEGIKSHPFTPLLVIAIFSLAGLFAFPVTLLIITAGLTFGPLWGSIYAILGSIVSAMMGYGVGYSLGRKSVQKLAGSSINKLSRSLAKHGLLAMITVRIIPVAPFTVINLVAGASHIKARDFFVGTVIGMLPGILGITVFANSLMATIKDPTPLQIVIFGVVVVLIAAVMYGLRKLLIKADNND